ncbi:MAG: cupin domain-containing protein [Bacteriovoracaceae bacterium]
MNRPSCIGNYKEFLEKDEAHYPGSDETLSHGSPIGKRLGLTRIGVHIEILAPGRRTSWPHAESSEEEFAYVIEGNPSVWIDGNLYSLVPGDFVAFPAGTGICHTFLNNTDKNCLLLVGGEASKKENKIFYPLHPLRNEEMKTKGFLWTDCPLKSLGPHDGKPDALREKENYNQ